MSEPARLLIVDDERRILETFSIMLEEMGHYVKTASDPDDALTFISEDEFDIVFLDQFLGRAKGLDLMQRMAKINPDLYYVIITSNGNPDLAVESLKRGASDFITKPFFIADLIKSIEYVNKKRELDKQKKELLATLESEVNEKTKELQEIYFSVLSSLAQAMEKKDIGTYGHSKRVTYYSRLIAAALDLKENDRKDLKAAALLHDIGKIGISDFILGKQGPLNEKEFQTVKDHPQKGVEILKSLKQFESLLPAILHHHENYDGSGYPHGLSGENIPLLARIIAVADTYDAILSDRPYRTARNHGKAINELLNSAGRQFDPVIINAFVKADAKYHEVFGTYQQNRLSRDPSCLSEH
jgi:putative nucleotidyltransferase with HDIG domain